MLRTDNVASLVCGDHGDPCSGILLSPLGVYAAR